MPVVAWVTLVAAALIIAATALALLRVIINLRHVHTTLGTVIVGVRSIADRTGTVPARLTSVNANLKPVRDWTETV
jgi:Kef-type K+ transport system membrane component KefB